MRFGPHDPLAAVGGVFLTAEWRHLAMVSFEVDPALLRPLIPAGTELDTYHGRVLMSLVGFRFLRTRVFGVRVPFHQNFDEVNLRFYVKRQVGTELRRGVTFIREIVPRRLIALVARLAYNEPYVALPMRSEATPARVQYAWRNAGAWQHLALRARGSAVVPDAQSETAFITDHQWGYTRQRDGSTVEYRVEHAPWRVWEGTDAEITGDPSPLYGGALAATLGGVPASAFLADGSPVTVFRPVTLHRFGP